MGTVLGDTERLALQAVAILVVGAILLGLADTPAYPLAIGVEIVALFAVLVSVGGSQALTSISGIITRIGG